MARTSMQVSEGIKISISHAGHWYTAVCEHNDGSFGVGKDKQAFSALSLAIKNFGLYPISKVIKWSDALDILARHHGYSEWTDFWKYEKLFEWWDGEPTVAYVESVWTIDGIRGHTFMEAMALMMLKHHYPNLDVSSLELK